LRASSYKKNAGNKYKNDWLEIHLELPV